MDVPRALDVGRLAGAREDELRALVSALQPGTGTRLPWGAAALRRTARRRATSHARRCRRLKRVNAKKLAVRGGGVGDGVASGPTNRAMRRRAAGGVPSAPTLAPVTPTLHRLPTHAWHAKRLAMVDDAIVSGWRVPASVAGAGRGDRSIGRRVLSDGALAVDASYWRPIVMQGQGIEGLLDAVVPEWRAAGGATAAARAGTRQITATVPAAGAPVYLMWTGKTQAVLWAHGGAVADVVAAVEKQAQQSSPKLTLTTAPVARLNVTGGGADRVVAAALAACGVAGRDFAAWKKGCGVAPPVDGAAFALTIGDARQLAPLKESGYGLKVDDADGLKVDDAEEAAAAGQPPRASVRSLFGSTQHPPPPSTAAIAADRQARRRAALGLPTAGESFAIPRAPLVAVRTRPPARSRRGGAAAIIPTWSLLLPWSWAPVVWRELVAPGRAVAGGAVEARWAATAAGVPFFPHDWPTARAAAEAAGVTRGAAAAAAAARPLGKRRRVPEPVPWSEVEVGGGCKTAGLLAGVIATRRLSPWPPHTFVHVSVTTRGGDIELDATTRTHVRAAAPPPPPGTRVTAADNTSTLLGFVTSAPPRNVPPRVGSVAVVDAAALVAAPRVRGGKAAAVLLTLPDGRKLRGAADILGRAGS